MSRPRTVMIAVALTGLLVGVALVVAASGGDEGETSTTRAPVEAPDAATPPSPSGLPPGIAECLADQGVELSSPSDLHSAPPDVLQACFDALHGGGGGP